ncbi:MULTISPECIES: hypothetical protein [Nitrosomonas]|uniref:hypothetical protein n=1 Tax=Nitrosomonas TaxID=914 RepID=UPI001935DD17|nr:MULTISPECIES: hypothetical protein [Nitrosomonas]QOJ09049.1 MAG: hypothetical protein HRU73_05975 [Nitrosomonas sp. H1_AOB3]HRN83056.1 hypothetical protein [Nitrosomonas europaea]HRO57180.1 hypothetical protein [Nitrosomonas europaea]
MSTYEDDLRHSLKAEFDTGRIREVVDAAKVFSQLSKVYPTSGSKIDWKNIPGAIERTEEDKSLQLERFVEFFDEMCSRFELAGVILYVGDSATDFALEGTVDAFRRVLPELVEIPQHHYFVGPACSWCICLTMEGDMGFGRATAPLRSEEVGPSLVSKVPYPWQSGDTLR